MTIAPITTAELDELERLLKLAPDPIWRHADGVLMMDEVTVKIRENAPALLAAARRGIRTESAWADAHDARYKQTEDAVEERDAFESQIGTIVGDIGLECEWSKAPAASRREARNDHHG